MPVRVYRAIADPKGLLVVIDDQRSPASLPSNFRIDLRHVRGMTTRDADHGGPANSAARTSISVRQAGGRMDPTPIQQDALHAGDPLQQI